jgi:hypothetical protein
VLNKVEVFDFSTSITKKLAFSGKHYLKIIDFVVAHWQNIKLAACTILKQKNSSSHCTKTSVLPAVKRRQKPI